VAQPTLILIDSLEYVSRENKGNAFRWLTEFVYPAHVQIITTYHIDQLNPPLPNNSWVSDVINFLIPSLPSSPPPNLGTLPPPLRPHTLTVSPQDKTNIIQSIAIHNGVKLSHKAASLIALYFNSKSASFFHLLIAHSNLLSEESPEFENLLKTQNIIQLYEHIITTLILKHPLLKAIFELSYLSHPFPLPNKTIFNITQNNSETWNALSEICLDLFRSSNNCVTFANQSVAKAVENIMQNNPTLSDLKRRLIDYLLETLLDQKSINRSEVFLLENCLIKFHDLTNLRSLILNINFLHFCINSQQDIFFISKGWSLLQETPKNVLALYLYTLENHSSSSTESFLKNLDVLLQLMRDMSFLAEAKIVAKLCIDKYRQASLDNSPRFFHLLNEAGRLFIRLREYEQAKILFLEVHNHLISQTPARDVSLGSSYNNIGLVNECLGNFEEAKEYLMEALKAYKRANGHANTAIAYHNLGQVEGKLNHAKEALDYYALSLRFKEKYYGPDSPEICMTLNNIGLTYTSLSNYNKAIFFYKRAIQIFGTSKKMHHNLGLFYFNLGVTLGKNNQFFESKKYLLLAYDIRKHNFGNDHPSTQVVKSWLSYFHFE
jgi:tetratricopeptide (TPR) repeat protein